MSWTFSRVLCSATRKQLWDEGRRWMSSATSMGSFSNSSGKMSDSGSDTATPSSSSAADSGVKGEEKTAHFGFEEVPFDEKANRVGAVFASVASNYDIMNDLMSGGLHRRWKDLFVKQLGPTTDMKILDMAGGTGDISFRIVDALRQDGDGIETPLKVVDASPEMVNVGRQRALAKGYANDVTFEVGDAMDLKNIDDESLDAYLISFGMRNVTDPQIALQEAFRVLRRGGRFMMLEFAKVSNLIERLYDSYSFSVIPAIGETVAGDRASYEYLVESIRKFPPQEEFVQMMKDAGFGSVSYENYTFGVVAQYSGFKL